MLLLSGLSIHVAAKTEPKLLWRLQNLYTTVGGNMGYLREATDNEWNQLKVKIRGPENFKATVRGGCPSPLEFR